jgi:solute carrier family 30 (zinc transporter), member 9
MASGSAKAVYAAIGANSVITITKLGAFAFTGSGAMLSEGIHSFADVLNQTLLALGIQKAKKGADEDHPYGYGRDSFVWALISAVGIFFLGCGFTLYHGVHSLMHPEGVAINDIQIALGVLLFSFVLESWTLMIAYKAVREAAAEMSMSFSEYTKKGPDPMAVAVLLEDAAAVFGVVIAASCIGLYILTGNPIWDAVASLLISALLGAVAIFLVVKNRSALLGQTVSHEMQKRVLTVLEEEPVVEAIHDVKATVLGADSFRFKAEIDFDGAAVAKRWLEDQDIEQLFARASGDSGSFERFLVEYGEHICSALGDEIDRIEEQIKERVPGAVHVDLEAD